MRKVLLGDICKPKQWKTISTSMLTEEGYSVYGANGVIGKYSEYNHKEETLLVTCRGATCGRLNICEPYSYVNGNAMALDDLDESVDIRYLYYVLKERGFKDVISGSAQPQIIRSALEKIPILIGTKAEQKEIVRKLALIDKCIEGRKSELRQLDELIKSRFVEMFGTVKENPYNFPTATLKEVCHKITDGKHGGCEQEANSGYYYIGAREIYDGAIHYDTAPQITYADFTKDYRRCNIEQGDMVIVNTGATIGKSAIAVSSLTERTLLQKSVALLKVKTDMVSAEFLRYCYMANPSMYMVKSASAQPNLLLSKMNATVIYLPPRELQEQFAAFVAQTDKSKLFVNAYFILIFCCLRCIINTSVKSKLSNDKGEAL